MGTSLRSFEARIAPPLTPARARRRCGRRSPGSVPPIDDLPLIEHYEMKFRSLVQESGSVCVPRRWRLITITLLIPQHVCIGPCRVPGQRAARLRAYLRLDDVG